MSDNLTQVILTVQRFNIVYIRYTRGINIEGRGRRGHVAFDMVTSSPSPLHEWGCNTDAPITPYFIT